MRSLKLVTISMLLTLAACGPEPRWYKGNLHTHSYWSDGDHFPEAILLGYRDRGYAFVSMSDHNTLAQEERWVAVAELARGEVSLAEYRGAMGDLWVETREGPAGLEVRLKRLDEYASQIARPGRFLVIQGEEITDRFETRPLHVNATNIRTFIPPQGGSSVADVLQRNITAVLQQRRETDQPMFPHVNHPNFGWAVTAEDLMDLDGERFFEVYNGHPLVHNRGDSIRPSTDRLWDIVLTHRLTHRMEVVYGIAVDDAHHYGPPDSTLANAARGWVMVRAAELTPDAIIASLEAGDFYASTGVVITDIRSSDRELSLRIEGEPDVTYLTTFIGTRTGYDQTVEPVPEADGLPVTRRYSTDIGAVLAEVPGLNPQYRFTGDEIYVRARVRSSNPVAEPVHAGEVAMAWLQPVVRSPARQ